MEACLLAGDDEDAGADDGAEGEPGEVPPGEAAAHAILAGVREYKKLVRVGGPVQEAVLEARTRVGQSGSVRLRRLERGFGEEGLPAPPPVASSFAAITSLVPLFCCCCFHCVRI